MQLSDSTVKILENFVGINSGIVIRKTPDGSDKTLLRTIDRQGVLYAETRIDEKIPANVCLYDLGAFLSVVKSFPESELSFNDKSVTVQSGKSKATVTYADPGYVIHPEKDFTAGEADHEFELTQDNLKQILDMGNVLTLPHLRIFTKDGKIFASACDAKTPNSSTFDVELGETTGNFDVFIKRDNIKMLPGDYKVKVKVGQFALFENLVQTDLFYCTGLELITAAA